MVTAAERNELNRKHRKVEEIRQRELALQIRIHDLEMEERLRKRRHIPSAWRDLADESPCTPRKGKLTLSLDDDMIKWYRSLGRGYQTRINSVLRFYMMNLLSEELKRRG